MKGFKKRKGVTLAEVIISLILISAVVAGMLTYFSTSFSNVFRLRKQNVLNFEIQESFETRLADFKKNGGNGTDVENFKYNIGRRTSGTTPVKGTTLTYDDKVKKIRLFVSNQKESVLKIPDDLKVSLPQAKRYYYLGQTTPGGVVGLKDDNASNAKIYTESGWFLSDRSIEKNNNKIVPVGVMGPNAVSKAVYPELLTDFKPLTELTSGVRITDNMRGKYLTFAARAINSYGRVGDYQEAQNRIWVMGLPIVRDLKLHTDADLALLRNGDGSTSTIPSDGRSYTNIAIKDYYHDGGNYGGTIPVQSNYEESIKQVRQLIALNNNNVLFSHHNLNDGFTTSVLIGNRTQTGPLLTYKINNNNDDSNNLTWGINLTNDGKLEVRTVDRTNLNNGGQVVVPTTISYQKDNSIQVRSSVTSQGLKMDIFINGEEAYTQTLKLSGNVGNSRVNHNVHDAAVIFGGNTYINEFALYQKALSDSDLRTLAEYFNNKYQAK